MNWFIRRKKKEYEPNITSINQGENKTPESLLFELVSCWIKSVSEKCISIWNYWEHFQFHAANPT